MLPNQNEISNDSLQNISDQSEPRVASNADSQSNGTILGFVADLANVTDEEIEGYLAQDLRSREAGLMPEEDPTAEVALANLQVCAHNLEDVMEGLDDIDGNWLEELVGTKACISGLDLLLSAKQQVRGAAQRIETLKIVIRGSCQ